MIRCKICGGLANSYTKVVVRDTHLSELHSCTNCGFVFIEPVYWLDEAYAEVVAPSDVGYASRNLAASKILSALLGNTSASDFFVDFGGGYGLLVRLMRDNGFRFHLYEPHAQNLFARNCEADRDRFGPYRALTAIEVLEHLTDPLLSVAEMSRWSRCLVFTTELCPTARPMPEEWWYFGIDHGQHISFYSSKALRFIAEKYGLLYYNLGDNWHAFAAADDPIVSNPRPLGIIDSAKSAITRVAGGVRRRVRRGRARPSLLNEDFQIMKRTASSDLSNYSSMHLDFEKGQPAADTVCTLSSCAPNTVRP
jgi:hypothetical protein